MARSRYSLRLRPRTSAWSITFSSTVRQFISTGLWNTMPTSGVGPVTGEPLTATFPFVGRNSPPMMRRSVLLPQPLGPRMEKNSPSLAAKFTLSRAWMSPSRVLNTIETSLTRMVVSAMPAFPIAR